MSIWSYIYIHLLLDRIDFTVRCAKLMEGISYFMILYFVFFQPKKRPSQKPWSRTPAPRGVDGIGGLDWGILHHMFFLLVDHSTKNTKWFIKGNSTWFWVLHFWEIWTLHTRHLSVSSSHLLDHSPFTSTLGQKYCLKNSLHQLCGLYVEVFTSMDGLVFGRLENFLKNEEYNTIPKANMKWKEQPVVWVEVFRISAWAFFAGSTCLCKKNGIHFYLHQECSTPLTCPAIPTKKLWCLPFQGISNPPKLKY